MADDRQRLAAFVRERRTALGLSQEQVAAAGGPSSATQRKIENGHHGSYPATQRRLETALGWEHGSARRILDGGDPILAAPAVTAAAGLAAAEATAIGAATVTEPDTLTRIGYAIAQELLAIEDDVWNEIRRQRRRGTPEQAIFDDPAEQALWSMPATPEEQRAANIAALRSVRPRPTLRARGPGGRPAELAS